MDPVRPVTATEPSKNTSAGGPIAGHVAPELIHVDGDDVFRIASHPGDAYGTHPDLAAWIKQAGAELMRWSPTYAAKAFVHDLDRDVIPGRDDLPVRVKWGEMVVSIDDESALVVGTSGPWSSDMEDEFMDAVDELLGFREVGP